MTLTKGTLNGSQAHLLAERLATRGHGKWVLKLPRHVLAAMQQRERQQEAYGMFALVLLLALMASATHLLGIL
ncbi:MAG: hypothetical protein WAX89_04300 [Alphaproteobacteria bacterium]